MGWFVEVCRKRGLKVYAGKSKVMNGEEGLECEVHVDGVCLEQVSEFKYFGCVLDEAGTDGAECSKKVANATRSLVNPRDLEIECVPVLTYDSETMLCMEHGPRDEPQTLTKCHIYMKLLKGGTPFVAEPITSPVGRGSKKNRLTV